MPVNDGHTHVSLSHIRTRKKEIDALATTSDSFGEFYERLRVIKDHHRKYPNELVEPPELQYILQQQQRHEDGTEDSGEIDASLCGASPFFFFF